MLGSAVAVSRKTLITNHHVIDGADKVELSSWDGKTLKAKILSVASIGDVAIIKTKQNLPKVAEPEFNWHKLQVVSIAGYPKGNQFDIVKGVLLEGIKSNRDPLPRIAIRAKVYSGNSGGPVFNRKGKLIAIIVEKARLQNNMLGLAIPIEDALETKEEKLKEVKPCKYIYR